MKPVSRNAEDLRGLGRLAVEGVTGVTDVVEAMHAAITHLPALVGKSAPARTRGLAGWIYQAVRGTTRTVGTGVDRTLAALAPLLGQADASFQQRHAIAAALNGVIGDHLEASENPLAIAMRFRRHGQALEPTRRALRTELPDATGKLLVLVHGLCMNDLQWNYSSHDHGQSLQRDLGYTPVYLHYNTGRHISRNGRDLAKLLQRLARAWPVPLQEITFLCHSMGGLVARRALDEAFGARHAWTKLPVRIVFLGTPHHGAPLERAGSWVDMLIGISPYSAPLVRLGKLRSAGIQDLRHGNVRDVDWQEGDGAGTEGRTPVPLPGAVAAYVVAASTQARRTGSRNGAARGDGLVPISSALGAHADEAFDLGIPRQRQSIVHGINHLDLLGAPAVYSQLLRWLRQLPR
ncbi:MAG: alpha/beta hydrolase [Lysobacteraceae bacterium]|nr:MAG: alpha/beta hydrolase [Xanthomonadaceae bacterium]